MEEVLLWTDRDVDDSILWGGWCGTGWWGEAEGGVGYSAGNVGGRWRHSNYLNVLGVLVVFLIIVVASAHAVWVQFFLFHV